MRFYEIRWLPKHAVVQSLIKTEAKPSYLLIYTMGAYEVNFFVTQALLDNIQDVFITVSKYPSLYLLGVSRVSLFWLSNRMDKILWILIRN